jgi:hypothetical protein
VSVTSRKRPSVGGRLVWMSMLSAHVLMRFRSTYDFTGESNDAVDCALA